MVTLVNPNQAVHKVYRVHPVHASFQKQKGAGDDCLTLPRPLIHALYSSEPEPLA
jgi:hypothetical protein